ncbi:hypothetical protein [Paraburkholderia sp. GAS32]|uniref:hypothetical protein n=1 Tax=Paraburkholderia sp. GAS32 TaxID=3035129 RepID=UPI003D20A4FC
MTSGKEKEQSQPVTLSDLNPTHNPARSPNLYRWMRKRVGGTGQLAHVYRVKAGSTAERLFSPGALLIGHQGDYAGCPDFFGSRLNGVLCNGSQEQVMCYPGLARYLEWVPDFWTRYIKVGRCAIDPEHTQNFVDADRFAVSLPGTRRTCKWCGAGQERHLIPRQVFDEHWKTVGERSPDL